MQKCTLKSNKLYNVSNLFSHRDLISHFQWFRWYYHGSTIAMVVYHHELVRIFRLESIEKKIILPTRQNGMRLVIARLCSIYHTIRALKFCRKKIIYIFLNHIELICMTHLLLYIGLQMNNAWNSIETGHTTSSSNYRIFQCFSMQTASDAEKLEFQQQNDFKFQTFQGNFTCFHWKIFCQLHIEFAHISPRVLKSGIVRFLKNRNMQRCKNSFLFFKSSHKLCKFLTYTILLKLL